MSQPPALDFSQQQFSEQQIDAISDQLASSGYIILKNALAQPLLDALQKQALRITDQQWHEARIGRNQQQLLDKKVRSDKIHWIDATNAPQTGYLNLMDNLREQLNQRLYMGLFDYESHFSVYQPGQFYQKHLDALKGRSNRLLSSVLYLNNQWLPSNGGELLIYGADQQEPLVSVIPEMGTLVIFLSEQFPHAVLSAKQTRYSIAGWFRVNSNKGGLVDPPR